MKMTGSSHLEEDGGSLTLVIDYDSGKQSSLRLAGLSEAQKMADMLAEKTGGVTLLFADDEDTVISVHYDLTGVKALRSCLLRMIQRMKEVS
jgi:hypothetical protein